MIACISGKPWTTRKLSAASPVLQLKIQLKNAKPPIWRRVLVPADMPLDQLHGVIQAVFGWLDYHLHNFQTGGFRGPSYAPVDPDGLALPQHRKRPGRAPSAPAQELDERTWRCGSATWRRQAAAPGPERPRRTGTFPAELR
ncbi:MAG: plasmid pRiA4b ORF-3 family protein [Actinomycetota bacterium]|nr:plasmid pRiA4b ORF-3 family protein [Actinomycetota bacterium]